MRVQRPQQLTNNKGKESRVKSTLQREIYEKSIQPINPLDNIIFKRY